MDELLSIGMSSAKQVAFLGFDITLSHLNILKLTVLFLKLIALWHIDFFMH